MFDIGSYVIYGKAGVCKILDVTNRIKGEKRDKTYYVLEPIYDIGTIYSPVDNKKLKMRNLITKKEADNLIKKFNTIVPEKLTGFNSQQIVEHYKTIIATLDCLNIMKLIKSIYCKKKQIEKDRRKFGEIDRRYMEQAEDLLYGEFAVALDIPKAEVPQYIAAHVNG